MFKKCRNILRNEKGLTLIELLAVVVILGIISAIAVPSIGGLIDNSKKDAHVANAKQLASSARLAVTGDTQYQTGEWYLTLNYLEAQNYIEPMKDPHSGNYVKGTATAPIKKEASTPVPTVSYVLMKDGQPEQVYLVTDTAAPNKIKVGPASPQTINRDNVSKGN